MANIIYNYDKSSCNCYKCNENMYTDKKGIPSNMSITNCEIPKLYDCYRTKPFRYNIEPTQAEGYKFLNPIVYRNKLSKDFRATICEGNNEKCCPDLQFVSKDPRLISVPHSGQVQTLDRPPPNSAMLLSEISTDKNLDNYGKGYRSYADIDGGYISYYIDKSIEDPLFSPVFANTASSQGNLYRDPMGAFKPQYERNPLTNDNLLDTQRNYYEGGLSWIRDSQEFREDIISKFMADNNEKKWSARWNSETTDYSTYK